MQGKSNIKCKKKFFYILNLFLILVIAIVIHQKFLKGYKELFFDCKYNSKAPELMELIEKNFFDFEKKELILVTFFNTFPAHREIEIIEKINSKYKDQLNSFTFIFDKVKNVFTKNIRYKS